jgi:acetyltransferase-like isoleucine patch superfamily enzyme
MRASLRLVSWSLRALAVWAYYRLGWYRAAWQGVRADWPARISPKASFKGAASLGSAAIGRNVVIGRGSYVTSGIVYAAVIGDYCSIGANVLIGPTEHELGNWTTSPYEARDHGADPRTTERDLPPPRIDDGVWIGANAVVLRGVRIGARSVIAAGAIVTKDVPPQELWGGVPAKRLSVLTTSSRGPGKPAVARVPTSMPDPVGPSTGSDGHGNARM